MFVVPFAVVISLLLIVFYVKPAFDEMQSLKKNQIEIKSQLDNLQQQNKKLSELKTKWDSMSSEKLLVDGALPEDKDMDNFTAELYERASRSGVLLTEVSAKEGTSSIKPYVCSIKGGSVVSSAISDAANGDEMSGAEKKGSAQAVTSCVHEIILSTASIGNWDQTVNFFKYVEDMNRVSSIKSIGIKSEKGNQSDGSDLITTEIEMSVYYKAKGAAVTPSVISSLTSGKGFEEGVIKSLKDIVFTPYVAPSVSESGERNLFK